MLGNLIGLVALIALVVLFGAVIYVAAAYHGCNWNRREAALTGQVIALLSQSMSEEP